MKYNFPTTRALIRLSGKDVRDFLQGIITNDIRKLSAEKPLLALLLSPQGKFLAEFFLVEDGGAILMDTEKATLENLLKRLKLYKLRADVVIEEDTRQVALAWEGEISSPQNLLAIRDPRAEKMGYRLYGSELALRQSLSSSGKEVSEAEYDYYRLGLGIPEGSKDAIIDRTIALENGYDRLGAVDFAKGCYVGQEVTARSHHLAVLRKQLMPVTGAGELPTNGAELKAGEISLGNLRSVSGNRGLALVRTEELEKAEKEGLTVMAEGVVVTVTRPTAGLL